LAAAGGLDGVVCSAQEAPRLRTAQGPDFSSSLPASGWLKRRRRSVAGHHAEAAIANGADYLVIGRPITSAPDPVAALAAINASLLAAA
jgi:orotidine-5'-phosphate decarboxylase